MNHKAKYYLFVCGLALGVLCSYLWIKVFEPRKSSFNQILNMLTNGDIKAGDDQVVIGKTLGKETVLDYYYDENEDVEYINAIYIRSHQYLEFYFIDHKIIAARYCAGVSTNKSDWLILDKKSYNQYFQKWIYNDF